MMTMSLSPSITQLCLGYNQVSLSYVWATISELTATFTSSTAQGGGGSLKDMIEHYRRGELL